MVALSVVIVSVAIVASAWLVARSLDRSTRAAEALAVAQFCAQTQSSSIHEADCDFFGRSYRAQAWLALSPPTAEQHASDHR